MIETIGFPLCPRPFDYSYKKVYSFELSRVDDWLRNKAAYKVFESSL